MSLAILTVLLACGTPADDQLAAAAKAVFATKCVQCHGPEVPHPKAGFGFITDLGRLVASGKYVVPGDPEKSEIWKEISEGDMPPDGAKAGPLTEGETEAIHAWIVAGAPVPQDAAQQPIATTEPTGEPAGQRASLQRLVRLIGRLHVIVVHFPIAMLSAAGLAELWAAARGVHGLLPSVRFCLWIGAVGAMAAAGLGWIHALDGFPGPLADPTSIAGVHRWLGTALAILAPAAALLGERDVRRGRRTPAVRGAILALALVAGVTGHFGGLLTHGAGFFDP